MSEVRKIPEDLIDVQNEIGGEFRSTDGIISLVINLKKTGRNQEFNKSLADELANHADYYLCEHEIVDTYVDEYEIVFDFDLRKNDD